MNTKALIAIGMALGLAACENQIDGTLKVDRTFKANVSARSQKKTVTITPGNYRLKLTTGPQTSKFALTDRSGEILEFRVPGLRTLRRDLEAGHVSLPGSTINQEFDLDLKLDVSIIRESGTYTKNESCVYDTYERRVCTEGRRECHQRSGTNGDGPSDFDCYNVGGGCHTETETVYGTRYVTGYDQTQQRSSTLKLIKNGSTIATMRNGSERAITEFIQTSSSGCEYNGRRNW